MTIKKTKFSLKKKLILLIVPIIVIVMVFAGISSYQILTNVSRTTYTSRSKELSETAANILDPHQVKFIRDQVMEIFNATEDKVSSDYWGSPELDAYLEKYQAITETEEYQQIRRQLQIVQDSNHLQASYLVWFDLATESTIYLVDGAYEDICLPGCFDAIMYDVDHEAMKNPEKGIAADVTNTKEYGWIVVAGSPVFCDGELVAFAAAEISMNEVMAQRNQFLMSELLVLIIIAVIFIIISIILIDRMLIRPINKLSETSEKYWQGETSSVRHEFAQLDIRTGDELETLSNSMKQMEQNINEHIAKIMDTTNKLVETREHADEMDRVANIDALTKVRNKRAYDLEIKKLARELEGGNTEFGMVMIDLNNLKTINDRYGHDKGNIAICTLCREICEVFVHSPVFRIGGDEFVVVLQYHDYEHLDELKDAFERAMEKNSSKTEAWESISAAAGYACYDPALDKDVESVFDRADQEMYKRKKQMKERS
ncbi:MAG: GGDEF domain-containing protein [Parasporobacterium sp.]|nr:GGDEF domain-containing protein [Parasporobacterium sp.]